MKASILTFIAFVVVVAVILDLAFIQSWRESRIHAAMGNGGKITFKNYVRKVLHWSWFFIPVLFAAIPVWFVFFDRWQNDPLFFQTIYETWRAWRFDQYLSYPNYFLLIFFCTGLLVLTGWFQRRHFKSFLSRSVIHDFPLDMTPKEGNATGGRRIGLFLLGICTVIIGISALLFLLYERLPGLEYAALLVLYVFAFLVQDVGQLFSSRRQKVDRWFSAFLAHVSIIVLLASLYSGTPVPGWGITWAFLAHMNLLRHVKKLNPVFWIVTLALILYSLWINAWWFSIIGDEYEFYRNAIGIVNNPTEIYNLFKGQAVYGTHPYLSSILQAVFLFLFGSTNFGWRFSSLYMAAVSIFFFYDFFQRFLSRRAALLTVTLLAGSHYLMTFGKIGYNNLQALFGMSLVLWASGWAIQSNRSLAYAAVGLAQGFCFYVFPAAMFAVPLPFLLFALYARPPISQIVRKLSITLGALTLSIFPLLLQPGYWESKIEGTFLDQSQLVGTLETTVKHLATNSVYAIFSPVYVTSEGHFVASSLVDPVTAMFLMLGGSCLVWAFFRQPFLRFLFMGLGYLLFLVGATHGNAEPPLTRMFMILPFWVALAAIGILWLGERMTRFGMPESDLKWVYPAILVVILLMNLWQAYPLSFRRMERYRSFQVLFLKLAQGIWNPEVDPPVNLLFITEEEYWVPALDELLAIYQVPAQASQWVQAGDLETAPEAILHDPNTLILFPPPWDGPQPEELQVLDSLGMIPCTVLKTDGVVVLETWYTSRLSWVCDFLRNLPFSPTFGTLHQ